jgi:hypothetical protein
VNSNAAGTGAYGDALTKHFRADASSYLVSQAPKKPKLAVTRVRRDTPGHGMTSPLPVESAYSVVLQLIDSPNRELFFGGRSVYRGGYAARTTSIVDLELEPTANLESPFDAIHFYVSRAALDQIADEQCAPRIGTLSCERGVFDRTVWHLGSALLPALDRPTKSARCMRTTCCWRPTPTSPSLSAACGRRPAASLAGSRRGKSAAPRN